MEFENYLMNKIIIYIQEQNIDIITINNNIITINNEPWLWNNIIKLNEYYLIKFIKLRKSIIDMLIGDLFIYFNCHYTCKKNKLIYSNNENEYDLFIINPTYKTSIIIQIFNSIIYLLFDNIPKLIFDTNLYTYSFLLHKNIFKNINNIWKSFDNNFYYLPLQYPNKNQDIWALLKLYSINKELINVSDTIKKFMIKEKINDILNSDNEYYYTKYSYFFEQYMKKNIDNNQENINKITNILSHMNYHGENNYNTIGAYTHVIGSMFYYKNYDIEFKINKLLNKLLNKSHLIHSMIENYGFFYKNYNKGLIYDIKYFERFMDAFILYQYKNYNDYDMNYLLFLNYINNNIKNKNNEIKLLFLKNMNINIMDNNIDEHIIKIIHSITKKYLNYKNIKYNKDFNIICLNIFNTILCHNKHSYIKLINNKLTI